LERTQCVVVKVGNVEMQTGLHLSQRPPSLCLEVWFKNRLVKISHDLIGGWKLDGKSNKLSNYKFTMHESFFIHGTYQCISFSQTPLVDSNLQF
jgi:hypothetical protein